MSSSVIAKEVHNI